MSREQEKKIAALETENFNLRYPVGTRVRFWTGVREGEGRTGKTWTDARLMSTTDSVVYIRDDSGENVGCVCLTHVAPLLTAPGAPSSKKQSPPKEEETFLPEGKQS